MDKSKAKKAVKKSESRKKQSDSAAAQAAAQAVIGMQAAHMARINPEIQAGQIDLQPADGYVNPYHAMGALAPTAYSAGNLLPGYNVPQFVNPET